MSHALAYVPGPRELRTAAAHTMLLLKLRWRLVRGTIPRAAVWVGLGFLMAVLFAASNIGYGIRRFAEEGASSAAGQYAVNYVIAFERGDLGAVGAIALGSVFAASLLSPFTGASTIALASADDLTGLRPNRLHRFFDSLVTQGISSIGFLQLVTLTAVGSLLTLDGGRTWGLLFTWSVWPVLLVAAVCESWAIELLQRSVGPIARKVCLAAILAAVGIALWLDPHHGQTLFGAGTAYSDTIRAAGDADPARLGAAFATVTALGVALFMLAASLCNAALDKPAVATDQGKERRRLVPISARPNVALLQVVGSQLWRTAEIRRPLITVLIIGIPAVWITGGDQTIATTMVIAIPLSVALAWGSNALGVLGPAMTWLASQPGALRSLLWIIAALQVGTTAILAALIWLPPTLAGWVNPGDVAAVAAGIVVASAVTGRSSLTKAVKRPFLAKLGSRGDVTIPPLTAVNYTLRYAIWGGQFGVIVMSQGDQWLQATLVAAAVLWSSLRFLRLLRLWSNRGEQARVVATVAAA